MLNDNKALTEIDIYDENLINIVLELGAKS